MATFIIATGVFALMFLAMKHSYKKSRQGGCIGCSGCCSSCHKARNNNK